MNEKYKDILNAEHHRSITHPHMSSLDRASQFASFAALTGHSDAIDERARIVSEKLTLTQEEMNELNSKLLFICDTIDEMPTVKITYFIPDGKKQGGAYVDVLCRVKKVDLINRTITTLEEKRVINLDDIYKMANV